MKYLVDSHTMKYIDETAQERFGIPAILLMERAALAVAEAVRQMTRPEDTVPVASISGTPRILALCGTGNNGEDGVAAARILHEWGLPAEIWVLGEAARGSELLKKQLQMAEQCGVRIRSDEPDLGEYTIVIDAIFGIGLTRAVEGRYAEWIGKLNDSGARVVAVDMPSGVNADNGRVESVAVRAEQTITFGYDKAGLQLYPGRAYAGSVQVADIGFPKKLEREIVFPAFQYEEADQSLRPVRREDGNKGTFGKVMVVAGSPDMCGACYLSAAAAFRTGAGMVKVLTVEENRSTLHALLPEAIVATWQEERLCGKDRIRETGRLRREMDWADALVLGSGLGRSAGAGALVELVLQYAEERGDIPLVIDADALYHIARNQKYVERSNEGDRCHRLHLKENWVITPHLKEMADLAGTTVPQIRQDVMAFVREITAGERFTLVLKDARTVTATVDPETGTLLRCVNNSGNSGMATAGAGDVLTGVIGALLAQGMKRYPAAGLGAYLHGLAGDAAAERLGREACMAGDILEGLAEVQRHREKKSRKD